MSDSLYTNMNETGDYGDTLGSLPPSRFKFKDKMEDIKEATLEGSQFDAQFPEERVSVELPLSHIQKERSSPRTQRDELASAQHNGTVPHNNIAAPNRPKTTLRRTSSEKSLPENDKLHTPSIFRSSQESYKPGQLKKSGSLVNGNISRTSSIERPDGDSRVSSQLSNFKTGRSRPNTNDESPGINTRIAAANAAILAPRDTASVIQKKGRVVEHAW